MFRELTGRKLGLDFRITYSDGKDQNVNEMGVDTVADWKALVTEREKHKWDEVKLKVSLISAVPTSAPVDAPPLAPDLRQAKLGFPKVPTPALQSGGANPFSKSQKRKDPADADAEKEKVEKKGRSDADADENKEEKESKADEANGMAVDSASSGSDAEDSDSDSENSDSDSESESETSDNESDGKANEKDSKESKDDGAKTKVQAPGKGKTQRVRFFECFPFALKFRHSCSCSYAVCAQRQARAEGAAESCSRVQKTDQNVQNSGDIWCSLQLFWVLLLLLSPQLSVFRLFQDQTERLFAAVFPATSPEHRRFVNLRDFFQRAWGNDAVDFVRNPVSIQCPFCSPKAKFVKLHRPNHLQSFFRHLAHKSHVHIRAVVGEYLETNMEKATGRDLPSIPKCPEKATATPQPPDKHFIVGSKPTPIREAPDAGVVVV